MSRYTFTERLFHTADRKTVVPAGHRDARFLLGVPGQTVSLAEYDSLGIAAFYGNEAADDEKRRAEIAAKQKRALAANPVPVVEKPGKKKGKGGKLVEQVPPKVSGLTIKTLEDQKREADEAERGEDDEADEPAGTEARASGKADPREVF